MAPETKTEAMPAVVKNRILFLLPHILLFTGAFIYYGFIADYISFYQEKLSLFVFSYDYFLDHLKQPGSLLIYSGKFLTTFFHSTLLGGIIISLVICTVSLSVSLIYKNLSRSDSVIGPVLAGLGIYFLQTDYHFLFYNSLGICLQVILFLILVRKLNGWLPLIILPLWYFITGSFCLVFCLMYSIYIIAWSLKTGWYKLASFWALVFVILYLSKEFIFFEPARSLLSFPLSKSNTSQELIPFVVLSGFIAFVPLISKIRINQSVLNKFSGTLKYVSGLTLIVIFLIAIPVLRYDPKDDQYFNVEKLFYQNRFNAVTDYLSKNPSLNRLSIYLNNIALCETGRLNDKLFQFRQDPEGQTLFLKWEMLGEVLRNGGYFYYATGMINEAHRWAYENMVMEGLTPEGLKMLIKTELINGNYAVASKYISLLEKTVFYRDEAKKYSGFLFNDKAVFADPDLGIKRKTRITHDFFTLTGDPYANIVMLLSGDSLNRKAFEYKLAFLLIRKDHKGIAEAISKLPMFGFSKIPSHLEEAIVVYKRIYPGDNQFSIPIAIRENTEARFARFMQTLNSFGNNPRLAEPYLRKEFGGTFWYWVFYR